MKKSTKITYLWIRILMTVVFIVGLLGLAFNKDESIKSEYFFVCSQSALFLTFSFVPNFLKKFELDIPDFIYIIFIFFILAHYFFGEILGFFAKVKWWDSVLHTFSGMLIALLSFSLINLLNKNTDNFQLNIWFAALFAFCFTVMVGVVWEIFEFCSDLWFDSNMQRAYVSTLHGRGEPLIGQEALKDTMKDLILDVIGAATSCIICIIAVCKKKIKVEDLSFIKKKKKVVVLNSDSANNLELTNTEQVNETNLEKQETTNLSSETEQTEIKQEIKVNDEVKQEKQKKKTTTKSTSKSTKSSNRKRTSK